MCSVWLFYVIRKTSSDRVPECSSLWDWFAPWYSCTNCCPHWRLFKCVFWCTILHLYLLDVGVNLRRWCWRCEFFFLLLYQFFQLNAYINHLHHLIGIFVSTWRPETPHHFRGIWANPRCVPTLEESSLHNTVILLSGFWALGAPTSPSNRSSSWAGTTDKQATQCAYSVSRRVWRSRMASFVPGVAKWTTTSSRVLSCGNLHSLSSCPPPPTPATGIQSWVENHSTWPTRSWCSSREGSWGWRVYM